MSYALQYMYAKFEKNSFSCLDSRSLELISSKNSIFFGGGGEGLLPLTQHLALKSSLQFIAYAWTVWFKYDLY